MEDVEDTDEVKDVEDTDEVEDGVVGVDVDWGSVEYNDELRGVLESLEESVRVVESVATALEAVELDDDEIEGGESKKGSESQPMEELRIYRPRTTMNGT